MSTPDTSEAVAVELWEAMPDHVGVMLASDLDRVVQAAITADRKALADAGYVIAPVVKLEADVLEMGAADLLRDLISAGLPIELEGE